MYEEPLTIALSLADQYGSVVIFVAFVLEGAVIGKLIPTRGLLVAIVLATGFTPGSAVAIVAAAVAGATVGQFVLFVAVRRVGVDPAASPRLPLTDAHVVRATGWFDRWGPISVAASNTLPVVRGTMTVPSALAQVSGPRFALYSLCGTILYITVLVGAASVLGDLLPFEPIAVGV